MLLIPKKFFLPFLAVALLLLCVIVQNIIPYLQQEAVKSHYEEVDLHLISETIHYHNDAGELTRSIVYGRFKAEEKSYVARIILVYPKEVFDLKPGDTIHAKGLLSVKSWPGPGLRPATHELLVRNDNLEQIHRSRGLQAQLVSIRQSLALNLEKGLENKTAISGLLKALILGYRNELDPDLSSSFRNTGTMHIFALSGLHIGLVMLFTVFLLKQFPIAKYNWAYIIIPVLLLYVLITGFKASSTRALIMASVYWGAYPLWRKPNALNALSLACIMILLYSPSQVLAPGFMFSFTIVLGLVYLFPRINKQLAMDVNDDWMQVIRPRWFEPVGRLNEYLFTLFKVSCLTWLCALPITATTFNMFTPVALIANLLIVPAAFLLVFLGMISLIFGSLLSVVAVVANRASAFIVEFVISWVELLERIPYAFQNVRSWPLWMMLGYYAILLTLVIQPYKKWGRKTILLSVLFMGLTAVYFIHQYQRSYLKIITGEAGQAVLFMAAGHKAYLIDAGEKKNAWQTLRAVKAEGVDKLEAIILTHQHRDFYGGLDYLADQLGVAALYVAPHFTRDFGLTLPAKVLLKGDRIPISSTADIELLSDGRNGKGRKSEQGLVLRLGLGFEGVIISPSLKLGGISREHLGGSYILSRFVEGEEVSFLEEPRSIKKILSHNYAEWEIYNVVEKYPEVIFNPSGQILEVELRP